MCPAPHRTPCVENPLSVAQGTWPPWPFGSWSVVVGRLLDPVDGGVPRNSMELTLRTRGPMVAGAWESIELYTKRNTRGGRFKKRTKTHEHMLSLFYLSIFLRNCCDQTNKDTEPQMEKIEKKTTGQRESALRKDHFWR